MKTAAIEFIGISKRFGDVIANADISFSIGKGHIHAIVGENGAGKSTAMKILFGLYQPDKGQILIDGNAVRFESPIDAMAAQVGMVHQHFMLAEPLTALDNILLHQSGSPLSILPRKLQAKRLQEIAQRYGFDINLQALISELSVGEQQRVEILKILSQNSEIIILDEPTAVLTPQEVQELFKNLRLLKNEGKTIIIITHKLKEVMSLSDSVTVFRSGMVVGNKKTAETTIDELAELMVGRRLQPVQERATAIESTNALLEFKNVSASLGTQHIQDLSFEVHGKEIVGIAGVEGNGQNVLIRALLDKYSLDKNSFSGEILSRGLMASFPEDRLRFGSLTGRPVYENFILGQQSSSNFSYGPFINWRSCVVACQSAMNTFDVRPRNAFLAFEHLSGGNQQKLVVARALTQNPQVILAAQPTRGVDIGAIEFIHQQLQKARDNGAGILLVSSELDELIKLSDRILVLYKGKILASFIRSQFDEIALGTAMGGGR